MITGLPQIRCPLDPPFANVVACSYYKLGDFESSFKLLTEIQSFFENDINYLCILGSVSRRLNNFDIARSSLEKALELIQHEQLLEIIMPIFLLISKNMMKLILF